MIARLRSPVVLMIGPILVLAIAFYVWTGATSASMAPGNGADPYNELLDGFQQGHLYLPKKPDPRLAALANPYDPAQNAVYVTPDIRDVVLFERRFYIYWGAAPAVVLMWPFRLLGLGDLPPVDAVLFFTVMALLSSVALLRWGVRRWVPDTPVWLQGVGVAALAFGNLAPWLLRRPESYEVAIAGGMGFFWTGMLALAHGATRERPSARLLALSSLLFGLAFSARPPLGIGLLFAAGAGVLLWRTGRIGRAHVAALAVPAGVCLTLVATYNQARFHSPGNFGTSFVLGGEQANRFFSLTYVPAGVWYYLLAPWRARAVFPYLWVDLPHVPFPIPRSYTAAERTVGLLPSTPMLLGLLAAPWALCGAVPAMRRAVVALVVSGLALMVFTAYFYWGAVQRYEADFATLLILPALLVWFAASGRLRRRRRRRQTLQTGLAALVAIGIVSSAAFSLIGSDDRLRMRHPAEFASLANVFDPVGTALASVSGHPILASVGGNPMVGPLRSDRLGVGPVDVFLGTGTYPIEVVAGHSGPAKLEATLQTTSGAPRGRYVVQTKSPNGSVYAVPVRGRTALLPLSLNSGRNLISLQMFADPATGLPAYINGFDDPGVVLRGLRVHR